MKKQDEKQWFKKAGTQEINSKPNKSKRLGFKLPNSRLFNKAIKQTKNVTDKIKGKPLLLKILYTLLMILIFRIAASITTPGVYIEKHLGNDSSSFLGIMDLMGGGTLRNFSIVALGISPYITASIIMTLLQSEVFPPIYRLARSGPAGKRKINIITRCLTLFFAVVTAITMIQQFSNSNLNWIALKPEFTAPLYKYFALPVILVGGSMFVLFLGEQITNRGVGNGTSLIIFSGIAIKMPTMFKNAYIEIAQPSDTGSMFVGIMNFALYIGVFLLFLFIITYVFKSERHIPIQQTGAGMTMDSKQMSRLPIKLNPAGVMPIIFALTIITLPLQIVQFVHHQNDVRLWIEDHLRLTQPVGLGIMVGLIFLFSMAMSFMTFNPFTIADNFKKSGTFIPGIRPGKETEDYLSGVIVRLSIFSGIYLSVITCVKYVEQLMGLSPNITFGGTTLLILVSVAVDTIEQLKARDTTNKISKARTKSVSSPSGDAMKGLLW